MEIGIPNEWQSARPVVLLSLQAGPAPSSLQQDPLASSLFQLLQLAQVVGGGVEFRLLSDSCFVFSHCFQEKEMLGDLEGEVRSHFLVWRQEHPWGHDWSPWAPAGPISTGFFLPTKVSHLERTETLVHLETSEQQDTQATLS